MCDQNETCCFKFIVFFWWQMSTMHQFVSGLKSRHEEARTKAAKDLQHYVSTELREVSADDLTAFLDDFNHQIFEMVSSQDVNEKKGGILAIGKVKLFKFVKYKESNCCTFNLFFCV